MDHECLINTEEMVQAEKITCESLKDMENRLEQTQLMISTLRHFGHEAPLKICHGNHCHYVRAKNEDGTSPLAEMVLEFMQKV